MGFSSYLPFVLLLLIPIIILLYLLKQKAEDFTFSSLFLWQETYRNMEATTPWEKLKNNLLMYLQIITVFVLILAIASPYLKKGASNYERVVLVVDTSGSMNTKYDDKQTRFAKAVNDAVNYVENLKEGTYITLLSMDKRTTILAANVTDKVQVVKLLENLKSTDHIGNPEEAIRLIASMAEQWEAYETVVYSDEAIDLSAINGTLIDVNSLGVNGCIDYVSYGEKEGELIVLVKVSNPSPYEFSTDINLYIDDELADIKTITLHANESQVLYFEGLKPEGRLIKAEINEKDYLEKDNIGYALLQDTAIKKVLLVTNQNVFIEKAVSTISGIDLYKTNDIANLTENDAFDLYIFDGVVPKVLPLSGNYIFIYPPESIEGICEISNNLENLMLTTVTHEVSKYMDNYRIGVTKASVYQQPVWAKSFLKADGLSAGYLGDYEGRTIAVLGFDFHNSDFPLQAEFPIFINNLVNQCLKRSIVNSNHLKTGDILEINADPTGSDIVIINPEFQTETLSVSGNSRNYDSLNYAGIYHLSQQVQEKEIQASIIVDFPTAEESVIRQMSEDITENTGNLQVKAVGNRGAKDLRNLCIIGVFLLLCAEWLVYLKRV